MLVAASATILVVLAMGCGLAGKVQNIVGTAKAVGEYSDKLKNGEKLTYTAEYKVDGGDTVTLTQQPPNSAFIGKTGRFIFTPTAMYLCSTENSVLACQKSVPTSGDLTAADGGLITAVAGQGFISPTLALGLIIAASVVPGAKVSQSTKTVAGQSSSCLTASNLDAAQSPEPRRQHAQGLHRLCHRLRRAGVVHRERHRGRPQGHRDDVVQDQCRRGVVRATGGREGHRRDPDQSAGHRLTERGKSAGAGTGPYRYRHRDHAGVTQGPSVHQGSIRARVSSPNGLTPGPSASAWPSWTCRHLTRVGMPPAETPAISGHVADVGPRGPGSRSCARW